MRAKLLPLAAAASSNGAALPLSHTKQLHAHILVASPASAPCDLRLLVLRSYSALPLFARMRRSATPPDAHTFACVVRTCADCSCPDAVGVVHGVVLCSVASSHPVVGSALVSGYAKLGLVEDATHVFDGLYEPDIVLWNAMMSGYGYHGMWHGGLQLFSAMPRNVEQPDRYSMVTLVSCFVSDPEALAFAQAQAVHGVCVKGGYDSGYHVRSALDTMYLRCACMESAQSLFRNLPDADLVTWSSLITGLLQTGNYNEPFDLFRQMCYTGRRPDSFLIASVLSACASAAAIECTRETHCYAVRHGVDIGVFSSLLDAYAKCGFSELGYLVFRQMPHKNSVLYNTVISNLVSHGFAANAIELLDEMVSDELSPDSATFSALLAGCCHVGLLDEGWKLFRRMRDDFHIIASLEHYVYMVRLLATFGQLKEAYDLIPTMPMQPDCGVLGAFLWGCCVHRDSNLGRMVAEKLIIFNPDKAAYRIMLSNLYASQGMWWDADEVRAELSNEDLHKNTGISRVAHIRQ